MKNKIIGTILTLALLTGLAACGNTGDNTFATDTSSADTQTSDNATEGDETEDSTGEDQMTESQTETAENDTETTQGEGNTLVVYYSATGNTEAVANMIAEYTNGQLFELEPVEPYTSEDLTWTNDNSRVSVEHNNPDQRQVPLTAATVDNWEEIDTVYIGYPIWWAIAAWPVNEFVTSNNFDGKTVIPFATAATSGIGESGELLAEMAGEGNWLAGECFRSNVNANRVQEWVDSLAV